MSSNVVPIRVARQAALDDPADLEMARRLFAPYAPVPLSREHEIALRQIQEHEAQIAKHAQQIRWLRMSLEST